MNKQELIEKLENLTRGNSSISYEVGFENMRTVAIELAKQLDEPQKVTVPKWLDRWIRVDYGGMKKHAKIAQFFGELESCEFDTETQKWIRQNYKTVVDAILNGCEVEEPTWVVKYYSKDLERECYFSMAYGTKGFDIDFASRTTLKVNAFKFESKEEAEALALLIDGTVEEL